MLGHTTLIGVKNTRPGNVVYIMVQEPRQDNAHNKYGKDPKANKVALWKIRHEG